VQAYDYITRTPFPVALHFVDTEGMRGGRERRGPGGALRNEAEVRVAAQVVRLLDERAPREMSMAVIAMYAEQVERLRQALGRRRFKRPVKIDTVDSFEGREEDMVVISLVRSNERGRIGFLRVPNRLNVAISRAKHLVACIGDSATLRAGEESMYGELVEAARSTGGWLSALEIVSPGKPQRRRRGVPALPPRVGPDGEPLAVPDSEEGARRRRRRRRRGQAQPLGDGQQQPTAQPPNEPVLGPDGEPIRRRRRRRRRGRGVGAGAGQPGVPGGTQEPGTAGVGVQGSLHFAPGETQSFRPRRRRRRRSGGGGSGGGDGAPATPGGEGQRPPVAAPPPPAASG
jgi:hypothetical protein